MADITVQFKDKETGEVTETTIPEEKLKTNIKDNPEYTVTVIGAGLSPAEQDPVLAQVKAQREKETGLGPTILGGLLQGVSLETVDELKGTDKTLAKRQEAENPFTYNASKFVGSLLPTAAASTAGAVALGGVGSLLGPVGTVGGGVLGALLGAGGAGTAESYFSKPEETRGSSPASEDYAMGALSALGEGAGKVIAPGLNKIGRKLGLGSLTKEEAALELVKKEQEKFVLNQSRSLLAPEKLKELDTVAARINKEISDLENLEQQLIDSLDEAPVNQYDIINSKINDIEAQIQQKQANILSITDSKEQIRIEAATAKKSELPLKNIGRTTAGKIDQSPRINLQRSPFAAAPQLVPNAPMSQEELAAYNQAIVGEAMQRLQAEKVAGLNVPPPIQVDEAEFAKQFKNNKTEKKK
jgi:hypothetical protein